MPILLFLHGGPGFGEMCLNRQLNGALEHDFLVVNWDQRGAGKSFNRQLKTADMTVEQMLKDTHEVVIYLQQRFHRDKIFLVGHSWGTYLGMKTIQSFPDDFYAYIGIGQLINGRQGDTLSYEWTLKMAESERNEQALEELKGRAAMKEGLFIHGMEGGKHVQRKWLWHYSGFLWNKTMNEIYLRLLIATEYSLIDKINYMRGVEFSESMLDREQWLDRTAFDQEITHLEIPVYFIQGKYDYNCPGELVGFFYRSVTAPKKEYIIFDNSAHSPNFEEPEKFYREMIRIKKDNIPQN